ncbi:MAG: glucose-6-phosphate dehydrogenase [Anaerolineales bacterium]|jgi:glucose-6-phosphate 1-dehydrogenase
MPSEIVDPATIVIFGASGDLTHRKLLPALFSLYKKGKLPAILSIVGYSRHDWDDEAFRAEMYAALQSYGPSDLEAEPWESFSTCLHHVKGSYGDQTEFEALSARLETLDSGQAGRLYYLAVPPQFFASIIDQLNAVGLTKEKAKRWRRVVIEKPFGSDLASAGALNESIHKTLNEDQIYRIDHYLGKETVQNVLVFRFANTIFEPIWNRNYIDNVQITVAEKVGVGHRAGYYDGVGVLRDMFQNHLMQLLTLVAMEPPAAFNADSLRNEKTKVLQAVEPILPDQVQERTIRARYKGYLKEEGVAADSLTETFAAVRFTINNWRWQGVPFYLRSGKKLAKKTTEIAITFKCPPHVMFPLPSNYSITPNMLAICLQPNEGIHLRFEAKVPDTAAEMRSVDMEFHYDQDFGGREIPDAYERLLLDALKGDASLFTRGDEIELAWKLIDPIIEGWKRAGPDSMLEYESGSWGPAESGAFLQGSGDGWMTGCTRHGVTGGGDG